jgi:hypothetical protein
MDAYLLIEDERKMCGVCDRQYNRKGVAAKVRPRAAKEVQEPWNG